MAALNSSGHAPLFSVLIPCYNVQEYVGECVESVIEQSFGSWEIVAVDDGSTDSTGAILDALKERVGSKMTVVHTPNNGQLLARRAAFRRATGGYFLCLDSDDRLRRDALGLLAEEINLHPGSLIQFQLSRSPDFGGQAFPEHPREDVGRELDVSWLRGRVCGSSAYNNLCGKVIPRGCIDPTRDYLRYKFMRNAEDLLQLVEVLDCVRSVVLVDDALYYYRINDVSITRTFQPLFFDSVRAANEALWESARQWGDPELRNLLAVRWLRAVFAAMLELSRSRYTGRKIEEELRRYASDGLTAISWERASSLIDRKSGVLLSLLMAGRYRPLALAILLIGKVRR